MASNIDKDKAILMAAFAKIKPVAMAVALGCVFALVLFAATAILLIKSALSGAVVGPHLALLAIYFPGYEVTWTGAFVGAGYLFVVGALLGFVLAVLWNLTHHLFVAFMVLRSLWWRMAA
jgi:hypothetical protein